MNLHTEALEWLVLGVATVPAQYGAKVPAISWGKYQNRLPTVRDLQFWYGRPRNLAVICGWKGLTVLDFDDLTAFDGWYSWASEQGGEAQEVAEKTYRVVTSRGIHLYVWSAKVHRTQHYQGVDLIALGGYVIGAGSVHPSGATYEPIGHKGEIVRVADALLLLSNQPPKGPVTTGLLSKAGGGERDPLDVLDNPPAELGFDPLGRVLARYMASDFLTNTIIPSRPGWGVTLCPLHDDDHPSLAVNLGGDHNPAHFGMVKCYAGCNGGRWMDAVRFYGLLHGLSDRAAVGELVQRLGG